MVSFSVVVPHRAATEVPQVSENQWVVDLPNCQDISDLCVFLRDPIIATAGVGVYFAFPPTFDFEFLGALSNFQPSEIFNTGWSASTQAKGASFVRLALDVEPQAALLEKLASKPPVDVKKEFARKVALNLFRYVESFGGQVAIPQQVLDTWMRRFEEKYKLDPNFVLRTE